MKCKIKEKFMPKVSVVMSVYNSEKYLEEAIDSILNQTFQDFEFIIINDGSTDNSLQILKSYSDTRLIVINQHNIGLTKSLNKGINIAKGQYIARMDSDDISLPQRFEKQIEFLDKNQDVVCIGTLSVFLNSQGKIINHQPLYKKNIVNELLLKDNAFTHGSAMFRKKETLKIGKYREYFIYAQDFDLWLRMSEIGKIDVINEHLYMHRITEGNISIIKSRYQSRYAEIARKLYRARRKGINETIILSNFKPKITNTSNVSQKYIKSAYHYLVGKYFLKNGNIKDSTKSFKNSLKNIHFFIPSILYLSITLLPNKIGQRILKYSSRLRGLIYKAFIKLIRY